MAALALLLLSGLKCTEMASLTSLLLPSLAHVSGPVDVICAAAADSVISN